MTTLAEDLNETPLKKEIASKSWIDMLEDSDTSSSMDQTLEIKVQEAEADELHEEFIKVKKNLDFKDLIKEKKFESEDAKKNRDIKIDFLDEENEKKFDRLVKEDKIKSPFKRRLSTEKEEKIDNKVSNEMEHKKTKFYHGNDEEGRLRTSSSSSGGSSNNTRRTIEYETDKAILERRQKQIDYGKNTIGYENYISKIPITERTKNHPKTPPKHFKYSRRAWDGLVKSWRKKLHCWDTVDSAGNQSNQLDDSDSDLAE